MSKIHQVADVFISEADLPPDTTYIIITPQGNVYARKKIAVTEPMPKERVFTWDGQHWEQT